MVSILNFSHPLTEQQLSDISAAIGVLSPEVIDVPVQFDTDLPFVTQMTGMIDALSVDAGTWQTETWLMVPPALSFITVLVLAELHGRTGGFVSIVRLRPDHSGGSTRYQFAEIINLNQVRQQARTRR